MDSDPSGWFKHDEMGEGNKMSRPLSIVIEEPDRQNFEGATNTSTSAEMSLDFESELPFLKPKRTRQAKARARRAEEPNLVDNLLARARNHVRPPRGPSLTQYSTDSTYTDILLSRSKVLSLPVKMTGDVLRGLVYPLTKIYNRQRLVVNLAQLQQLNLQHLRAELAREVSGLVSSRSMNSQDSARIRALMTDYCAHSLTITFPLIF